MGDLWTILAPFFSTPTDYKQMLKKLAGFAFWEVYLITFLLRNIPSIDGTFHAIETYGALGKAVSAIPNLAILNPLGLGIAIIVAFVSHASKFHDRISDVLGIRKRFDRDCILVPLAQRVGAQVPPAKMQAILSIRHDFLRKVYYKYTSSRAEHPLVDKHDIEHALGAWSWYWVCIEGAAYFSVAAIIALARGGNMLGLSFLAVVVACIGLGALQRRSLPGYSRAQIVAIVADADAAKAVRAEFDAL